MSKTKTSRHEKATEAIATNEALEVPSQPDKEPHPETPTLRKKAYRKELAKLQVELFKLQAWVQSHSLRLVVVLEGLGPAGKQTTLRCITEGLDRRVYQVVSLDLPGKRERGQWHFQRYVQHLPPARRIAIFDGSWYHVPCIARALGMDTEQEFLEFLRLSAEFEQVLVRSGVLLVKYWFSSDDDEQQRRFLAHIDEVIQHKKPNLPDRKSVGEPVAVATVKASVIALTDTQFAPWYQVNASDKRRARLNCIKHLLSLVPDPDAIQAAGSSPAGQGDGASPQTTMPLERLVPQAF